MVACDYCGAPAELVTGLAIYIGRPNLAEKRFWRCVACDAYVGCHPGGEKPLGRLANRELRSAKIAAHAAFDPFWTSRGWSRNAAYRWLADALGMDRSKCHIGMFDVDQCKHVIDVCRKAATESVVA